MNSVSSTRLRLLLSTAVVASLALPGGALAQNLPVAPAPNPNITTNGNTMTVGLDETRTVINWNSFDIGNGYTVDFDGSYFGSPNPALAVLNRVGGTDPSDIFGTLKSDPNIDVFLINPNGITFGNGASVNVGSLMASTLNITDGEFLAAGGADGYLDFSGTNSDPNAVVSTGVTVTNGALVSTTSGQLVLIGASVDVQAGGSVSGATDVGLAAGNSVRLPASPGSPIAFQIGRPTPTEHAITVSGDVSGRSVTAFMIVPADAVDALLVVSDTGSITATRAGGGDIILGLGADENDTPVNSPGRIQNDGTLTASNAVVIGGSNFDGINYPVEEIANNGEITAGDNVYMQAWRQITNTGTIDAEGDVTFSALATGDSATPDLRVANSGTITAGDDVRLVANAEVSADSGTIVLLSAMASALASAPDVQVTNTGTINAGGDVTLGGSINISGIATDTIALDAAVQVVNEGAIAAGGNVELSGVIDISGLSASSIAVAADVDVINDRSITAGGDVILNAAIDISGLAATDIAVAANAEVLNNGMIDAAGDVSLVGSIDLTEFTSSEFVASDIAAAANVEITNSGTIEAGGNASMSAFIDVSSFDADSIAVAANAEVVNSESIAAGGDVSLIAEIEMSNFSATDIAVGANAEVLNNGTIDAGGDVNLVATVDTSNFDAVSITDATSANVINSGTINAGGNGFLSADGAFSGDITNSGVISVGGVATLVAVADIDNGGSISAGGDAILTAGGDILDSSGSLEGSVSGRDVALSAGGDITAGTVTARDDIAIRAPGMVTTGSLTSGATIDGDGPVDVAGAADELLPGVDLSGQDVDVDGSAIAAGVIRAIGTGSDIRLRAPVTASGDDLDFAAGGDITVDGPANGVDVVMDAGGTITAGDISARDDLVLIAGGTLVVGTLQSGATIGSNGPVDQTGSADVALGETLAGHDLYLQASEFSRDQLTASGTNSDLTVRTTTGQLSLTNGSAGGEITLIKEGTAGTLTAGTLTAGTGVTLRSATDIDVDTVQTASGDLDFAADRDVTVDNPLAATDVAIAAGGTINTGNITARDDIALRAGTTLNTGTLASGVAVGATGPLDTAGAADALLNDNLAGHDLSVQASAIDLAQATANGAGSDLIVRATTGGLSIADGEAGGSITLVKEGTSGILSAGTLIAGTGASLTSATDIDVADIRSTSGDLEFDAMGMATLGIALAQAGKVIILADDLDITGSLGGGEVSITNREGGNVITALGDASGADAFTLTEAELNRIDAAVVNIDSLGQDLLIGNVALDSGVGSTRVNLLGTGRVDVVGELSAAGAGRTIQLGGTTGAADPQDAATMARIIRIAPTSSAGGRIILDGAALDLRGAKIGVGLDDGFLTPLGLVAGGAPLSVAEVAEDWIGNPNSTLYGIPGGYANPLVISASSVTVTYADYALFQNTAPRGETPTGVEVGTLTIVSSGLDAQNGFSMFGNVQNVGGRGAALLVQPQGASMPNSRVNGCLIVTGGGCGGPIVPPNPIETPPEPGVDGVGTTFAAQALVSTDEDQLFTFESLVGTNNEGLLGALGADDATDECDDDDDDNNKGDVCKPKETTDGQ